MAPDKPACISQSKTGWSTALGPYPKAGWRSSSTVGPARRHSKANKEMAREKQPFHQKHYLMGASSIGKRGRMKIKYKPNGM
jgi:hypothetical protein